MRILIASKRAPGTVGRRDGGVQTWIATIRDELVRRQCKVTVWAPDFGPLLGAWDVGIFANAAYTEAMALQCRRVLFVSHGRVEDERPPIGKPLAFTSEDVRAFWQLPGPVIRQPINLYFWSPENRERVGVVRYANRGGLGALPLACASLGLPFAHVRGATMAQAREAMRRAAVVVASGRAAVEAMACGARVVIADERGYQGALLDLDPVGAMARNYSGRGGVAPNVAALESAICEAMTRGSLRAHVEEHHDARKIARQIMEAAQ